MEDIRDTIKDWLRDAYAMEKSQQKTLEGQIKHADSVPELQSRLRQHLSETEQHADIVKSCLERMGGDPSAMKDMMGNIGGFFAGRSNAAASDSIVKDTLGGISSEHFEIACYKSLRAAAEHAGETMLVNDCDRILADEKRHAEFLEQRLPELTRQYLQHA